MNEYYVFDTEQEAIDAELQLRQLGNMPWTGVNALTLSPVPEVQTIAWAIPQERLDGKWVFPRVPEELRQQYQNAITAFISNHTFTIEEYQDTWFPVEEIL